ncbi:unnamed protein product [Lactuca virosa]|uniref:Uncharacterized protein n=1 Tax=Lactuca virosa TaxID=75947 RepID=A0AAU9P7Y8_9ASTR|nr:unnamed protein product [Lactuca virosa]
MVAGTTLSKNADSWEWKAGESKIFSVKSDLMDNNLDIHNHMGDFSLGEMGSIKANCFVWSCGSFIDYQRNDVIPFILLRTPLFEFSKQAEPPADTTVTAKAKSRHKIRVVSLE